MFDKVREYQEISSEDKVKFRNDDYPSYFEIFRIGPDEIRIKELVNRVQSDSLIKEIVIATNLNLEGEATAMYINQIFSKSEHKIKITRLARGLPSGSDIEYADETTILHAMGSRVNIDESL